MYPFYNKKIKYYTGRRKKYKLKILIAVLLLIILASAVTAFILKKDAPETGDALEVINIDDMPEIPENIILVKEAAEEETAVPVKVKGVYVTAWTAGNSDKLNHFIELCGATEINALVIDIKDDRGNISFLSETGQNSAANINILKNIRETVSLLKSRGIYTIARIVCFKDPIRSSENPASAIKDKSGNSWKDNNGNTWLNPYKTEAWDYIISVAREAAEIGFDEVQFDYVRFPTDGVLREIDYGEIAETKSKTEAISEFLAYAKTELKKNNIFISADVFGIIAVSRVDSDAIGQDLELISQRADSICPMIYPSHYANKRQNGEGQRINGILFEAPDMQPYEVIYNTLVLIKNRVSDLPDSAAVRPYLQDFTASYLGAGYYQKYTAQEVREQIQAVYDAGFEEWILWNAASVYSEDAFR